MHEFEEEAYLIANPDVRDAVQKGAFRSGFEHYSMFGQNEKRPLNLSETRTGRILQGLDISRMSGIEIGALASPLVRREEGVIKYVDHASTKEIIEKYKHHSHIDATKIVEVDAVWGTDSLRQAIGGEELFDYVLASHVVEHIPDLISWLMEIKDVLKPTGKLRLYVPDKRFEFDYLRSASTIADVLDAYIRRTRAPLPRMILDYHALVKHIDVERAWQNDKDPSHPGWLEGCRLGISLARDMLANGTYHDVHCWVFTPKSFAIMFMQCAELGLIRYRCDAFQDTRELELEFMIGMTPCDNIDQCVASWRKVNEEAKQHGSLCAYDDGR